MKNQEDDLAAVFAATSASISCREKAGLPALVRLVMECDRTIVY